MPKIGGFVNNVRNKRNLIIALLLVLVLVGVILYLRRENFKSRRRRSKKQNSNDWICGMIAKKSNPDAPQVCYKDKDNIKNCKDLPDNVYCELEDDTKYVWKDCSELPSKNCLDQDCKGCSGRGELGSIVRDKVNLGNKTGIIPLENYWDKSFSDPIIVVVAVASGIIEAHAFENFNRAIKVIIKNNVIKIGDFAFRGMKNLEDVEFQGDRIPGNIEFGSNAFKGCLKLTEKSKDKLKELGYKGSF